MPLVSGVSIGPYQIVAPLGAGGMSACGYAEPRTCESEARHQRQFAGVEGHITQARPRVYARGRVTAKSRQAVAIPRE